MRRAALLGLLALAGCGNLQRLSEIGRPPPLSPMADPTRQAGYRPLTMPMPTPRTAAPAPDALWRAGSRAFFKDQRAAQVGDLLTVVVNINDTANIQNTTTASRTASQGMGLPNLFGLEAAIPHIFPGAAAASLVSGNGNSGNTGTGQIKRGEQVSFSLAGVVTQVLPNGNLVIVARQEMRVGSELRQLELSGVVRPQDIASDNTVPLERLAEARVIYGGRGQLTDMQTPRWGQQVLDQILPF